jgi:hypothetical protein
METFTIKAYTTDSSQISAIKAFMKALKIKFEMTKDKPYNTSFIDMVLGAEKEIKANKGTKVSSKEFDKLWK